RRSRADIARLVAPATLWLRPDRRGRSHPAESRRGSDGRCPAWTLQGGRFAVRRRGPHQPHPRRAPGRAPVTLPAATAELARWRDEGLILPVWWRDDDAVAPTPALERLLELAGRFQAPLHLAVIPEPATSELAERLRTASAFVLTHGWRHAN